MKRDPKIITSDLSKTVSKDGVVVEVHIFRLEKETGWALEVVNENNTSTTWDDLFPSDEAAFAEFTRVVTEEGIEAFMDGLNVVPFQRQ
ncbi:hypothetical protein [Pelagibacterium luteolum]|uniref:Uncharacterized protein n=1 Tax=Pelagibacterium luteolum TaxID=440168 RepID=A0A1G7V1L2_9HYPH|nr:hypothetical protein [Pelagibacterium luteolum]SDG53458.1 hypothetical protein SAMN04487974_103412 [Pelagibacterium luteolum]